MKAQWRMKVPKACRDVRRENRIPESIAVESVRGHTYSSERSSRSWPAQLDISGAAMHYSCRIGLYGIGIFHCTRGTVFPSCSFLFTDLKSAK